MRRSAAHGLWKTPTPQEKTAQAIQREAAREIATLLDVLFIGSRKRCAIDLEAIETATRAATHRLGAKLLDQLLSTPTEFERSDPLSVRPAGALS